jgi:hypothetical protein
LRNWLLNIGLKLENGNSIDSIEAKNSWERQSKEGIRRIEGLSFFCLATNLALGQGPFLSVKTPERRYKHSIAEKAHGNSMTSAEGLFP